jgi:hypothetical protein
MKLSLAQVERVEEQYDGQLVPEGHDVAPQLENLFGEHTFFLDAQGLNIVEPSPEDGHVGNVINLATWTDEKRTMLAPHAPEPTPVVIELGEEIDGEADEED